MQTLSSRRSSGLSPQTRRIATFAIILFALSGLISGFAVGAFVRPKHGGTSNSPSVNSITPIVQQTKTATPVATVQPVQLPFPTIDHVESTNVPNGTTYTLTAHLDNVTGKDGQPVHADNLTCKLWLISRVPTDQKVFIPADILSNVATISNPFTAQAKDQNKNIVPNVTYPEIQPGLSFDGSTAQTQPCRTDGEVTWRYQISPQATPGKYTLVVLYDWSGKHYNWSWVNVTIKQANSN
ncbi:MAG: hypothetical protein ACRDIV_12555 [Ktedonobacteraceae bacterium]